MTDPKTRVEHDAMGEIEVPADAYYGASTRRAAQNFPISGLRFPRRFLRALGLVKAAAARANRELGRLSAAIADAIETASREVAEGRLDDQFVVDVFQTGSGTSTNMNANEVIAARAAEILGHPRAAKGVVHPNDHVNLGQSSNDVFPTAVHLAAILALREVLLPAIETLRSDLAVQSGATWEIVKTGRTHLQDATPIRMGQVFLGFEGQMERAASRLAAAVAELSDVPLGGTAVGTGINTHPEFAARALAGVSSDIGFTLRETGNHFQAQATIDAIVAASGAIRTAAVSLHKIADDVRWLASGPRCGLGEIEVPAVQPGSSIMPGKVNPVIAESLIQACAHAIAADAAIVQAGLGGQFELNTMSPLAAWHLVGSIEILGAAAANFAERCVRGIRPTHRGPDSVERGLGLATALVARIGYDAAVAIAFEAAASGRTVRQIARERSGIAESELDVLLDPMGMTAPDRP